MAENTHQLVIHLPESLREDFKDACKHDRRSMAEVLRGFIIEYIDREQ
jgi:hypothetical protein